MRNGTILVGRHGINYRRLENQGICGSIPNTKFYASILILAKDCETLRKLLDMGVKQDGNNYLAFRHHVSTLYCKMDEEQDEVFEMIKMLEIPPIECLRVDNCIILAYIAMAGLEHFEWLWEAVGEFTIEDLRNSRAIMACGVVSGTTEMIRHIMDKLGTIIPKDFTFYIPLDSEYENYGNIFRYNEYND